MSDTPEPLAAILAEMKRRADEANNGLNGVADVDQINYMEVEDWVSRIEAAAERERQDAMKTALLAKCKVCEKVGPASAPGNAAAIREALERIVGWCEGCHADTCEKVCRPGLTSESIHAALAALAAPARNCDRYATAKDALDAFIREKEIKSADVDNMNLRDFFDWLFAKAEGKDKSNG